MPSVFLRTLRDARTDPSKSEPWQLRVERDPDWGLATIADEEMTSMSPRAQRVDGVSTTIELTRVEAVWLRQALDELLQEWEE